MFKSTAFFIGTRYILARKDNRFISFTSLISMAGLTLGVLALIIVLSVFNGSQGLMRDRTLITVPHGDIHTADDFPDWQRSVELLLEQDGVESVSPYIVFEAMVSERGFHQVTEVKGILPEAEIATSTIEDNMVQGSLQNLEPGARGIVLGQALAANLRLNVGDPVNLIIPEAQADGINFSLNMQRFTVAGIFDVQFTIGSSLALIHLDDSRQVLGLDSIDEGVRLRLKVNDIDDAASIVEEGIAMLETRLPGPVYQGEDWSVSEAGLFNALKMEKIMTSFMLMMIVAIGAFNIISTLVMVVSEKQADIAILRTMGASETTILMIFMVQGVLVGILGTCLGAALGILIAAKFSIISSALEQLISPAGIYMISALPAELHAGDVAVIIICALIISFLATLYPAYKASRIQPAEVLRYE